jgi:hypothetical protein
MNQTAFAFTTSNSTSKTINIVTFDKDQPDAAVGKLIFFDTTINGEKYRALGTVATMLTENSLFSQGFEKVASRGLGADSVQSTDVRKSTIIIQAVFRQNGETSEWEQYGSALPTSPSTRAKVYLLTENIVEEMLQNISYPTVGWFRGLKSSHVPLALPNYGSATGAKHLAVLGKSGSGKTALSGMLLSAFMSHESHAIMVIDPQGQWANENGMPLSPQKMAKGLGRKVTVVRISEDVKMPMDAELFGRMMDKLELWKRFRRMGFENRDIFSREVAERIAGLNEKKLNENPREVLSRVFRDIAYSQSTLSRIYAKGDRQEGFRDELLRLIGEPVYNEEGEIEIVTDEDKKDIEKNWESILAAFTPLHSLFSNTNLNGEKRRPLGGQNGFMAEVFKVRKLDPDEPAPYVIIDMSPNIKLHAKAEMAKNDMSLNIQKVLDNADIKALMLMIILQEMKRASETAFATSFGGNLNTQIVFDEAWRFAPEGKASPEIEELAAMLEGFALDTRKFGIGWTYILQSPGDLKSGIWRQLTYVVAGYGLVGEDVRKLESLTDDVAQVELYRQFISPTATNEYPFMFMGPISPLIFSTSPTFLNAFNTVEDFLNQNRNWIEEIITKRRLTSLTAEWLKLPLEAAHAKPKVHKEDTKEYGVGKNYNTSEPQTVLKAKTEAKKKPNENKIAPPPF